MTVRYVLLRVEMEDGACTLCGGLGRFRTEIGNLGCPACDGKGQKETRTEIDADAWLRAALDGYGLLGDGK